MKVHHALVDGMAALGMAALVLDPTPEPMDIPPAEQRVGARRYDLRRHVTRLAGRPLARAPRMMLDGMPERWPPIRAVPPATCGGPPRSHSSSPGPGRRRR